MRILLIAIGFFIAGILLGKLPQWLNSSPNATQPDFVGVKVPLKSWPSDSLLRSLDSIPVQEWINDNADANFRDTVESVSKVIPLSGAKPLSSTTNLSSSAQGGDSLLTISPEPKRRQVEGSNAWLPSFTATLKAMSEGGGKSQTVTVATGELKIADLLLRVYGDKAKQIPVVLIKFSLQPLNPSVNFENLQVGQSVRLPKI